MKPINEKLLLFILAAIQFTNIVDFMIMMPMGDILKKSLQIGPGAYGWLVSSYGLAAGVTSFLGVFYQNWCCCSLSHLPLNFSLSLSLSLRASVDKNLCSLCRACES